MKFCNFIGQMQVSKSHMHAVCFLWLLGYTSKCIGELIPSSFQVGQPKTVEDHSRYSLGYIIPAAITLY